ncbi:hypothetical protein [Streptacidiphilus sp. EB129]|uniref:hypothetical protein n=1 Tax=Streptacidiphilus sp. EB129 TaxID=3156262 RepID=UPI003517E1D7
MDPEVAALVAGAGTTMVGLVATDAWQGFRNGMVALWRRAHPDRADAVAGELDAAREELLAADPDERPELGAELASEWQGRTRRLLAAHPEAAEDLRALLDRFAAEIPSATTVVQRAIASGHARVYQAGRDMTLRQD